MLRAIGLPELMVIGAVFVLLFGGPKIADLGKGLGQSIKEFRGAFKEAEDAQREMKKS